MITILGQVAALIVAKTSEKEKQGHGCAWNLRYVCISNPIIDVENREVARLSLELGCRLCYCILRMRGSEKVQAPLRLDLL